jgi:NADH:ubiquinone oxidoreductase subunit E
MDPEQALTTQTRNGEMEGLIALLERIQARYNYLPEEALREVSASTGRSLVDIYGVATFYRAFSLKPRGKHLVSVCLGTACHVRGGPAIAEEFERRLGIRAGETTDDREFTLETVNCLGACALGPVAVVNGKYFSKVRRSEVKEIIRQVLSGAEEIDLATDQRVIPVEVNCPRCNHSLMDSSHLVDGLPSIRVSITFGRVHGWMCLSALYGSYNVVSEYPLPANAVIHFFCPHCHEELSGPVECPECGAPMVRMIVRGGGVLQVCSRKDCKAHTLDI